MPFTTSNRQYPLFKTTSALQNNVIHHLKPRIPALQNNTPLFKTIPALQNNTRSSKQCHSPPQTDNTRSSKQCPLFKTMPFTN